MLGNNLKILYDGHTTHRHKNGREPGISLTHVPKPGKKKPRRKRKKKIKGKRVEGKTGRRPKRGGVDDSN